MSTLGTFTKTTLAIAVAAFGALLLIASLPALGVVAVVLRVAALAVLAAALVICAVTYIFSPRFRSWLAAKLDSQPSYLGLRMRDGVWLDDGHSWSRKTRHGLTIGVDDLVQRALGPVDSIELPAPGSHIERGDTLLSLWHGRRRLNLRSPVSGTVRRSNGRLSEQPGQINDDPYGEGWAVVMQPKHPFELDSLHGNHGAREWFCREVDRLLQVVVPAPTAVMADGGIIIHDLHDLIDEPIWERLRRDFFERPIRRSLS